LSVRRFTLTSNVFILYGHAKYSLQTCLSFCVLWGPHPIPFAFFAAWSFMTSSE
jgi:hypothetical protein